MALSIGGRPQARLIPSNHVDFVLDAKYDYYGKRLATCSSDQTVRVWDLDEKGDWHVKEGCEWKNAHHAMIWKLAWAHPEFGQVLATCSADGMVKIWEEQEGIGGESTSARWYPKSQLSDSRKHVKDIKFAPRHLGLKIAAGSADGCVRIYEAIDVMNLNHWPMQELFEADASGGRGGVTCLSWNTGRFEDPSLVVGTGSGRVQVWTYDATSRSWRMTIELKEHVRAVCDVGWAPNVGRNFHLVASCSKDKTLRVHKLTRLPDGALELDRQLAAVDIKSAIDVWRLEWNITGTILAASGDDTAVHLWKSDFKGDWVSIAQIDGDLGEAMDTSAGDT